MVDHAAFVGSLYAAFGRGDLGFILEQCAADIAWESNCDADRVPWGGRREGLAGVTAFFQNLTGHLEFEVFEPGPPRVSGDTIFVLGRTRARHRHAGQGVFDCEWVHVFTMADGRLARFQEFYDTAAVEHALRV